MTPEHTFVEGSGSKRILRNDFRLLRRKIDPVDYQDWSRRICSRLLELPELAEAETVHCYWPLLEQREVDTRSFVRSLYASGRRVVLPVIEQPVQPGMPPVMVARSFEGDDSLYPGAWGIMEPRHGDPVDTRAVDFVVVPALAIDRQGYRLGYGKGFYDRFLGESERFSVGLAFSCCLRDSLPRQAHDVAVSAVATERELLRFESVQPDNQSGVKRK